MLMGVSNFFPKLFTISLFKPHAFANRFLSYHNLLPTGQEARQLETVPLMYMSFSCRIFPFSCGDQRTFGV